MFRPFLVSAGSHKVKQRTELIPVWQQLDIARQLDTKQIWIMNVGDLHFLETPTEYFMSLAYDFETWDKDSFLNWCQSVATRDFGVDDKKGREIAEIMALYSVGDPFPTASVLKELE